MTFRSSLAVAALALVCSPLCALADPQAALDARVEATASTASDQAVGAALAREDAALARAIAEKIAARTAAALAPPVATRARAASVAARTSESTGIPRRPLYAVK